MRLVIHIRMPITLAVTMFLGEFDGGELVMETGERYSAKRVWHRYDGARVTHWNTEHSGDKNSVIVHNNKTTLCWKNFNKKKISFSNL